jgi:hypothetical protein
MTALITLTTAGTDSGPFNLYSNLDGYVTAFETAVPKVDLLAGYSSSLVPDFTTTVRVLSTGACTNYIDIVLAPLPTTTTTTTYILPITGLTWALTVDNPCDATPWDITNSNLTIRYNVTDSAGLCGGTCSDIQAGTATATITVGGVDVNMGLAFDGIGELEQSDYEQIIFILDGNPIADAHAAGGSLGCAMGPVVQTFIQAPPYLLLANSVHTLLIDFTTADALYHLGSYYEVDLSFTEA